MKTIKSYLGTFAALSLLLATGAVSAAPMIDGAVTFNGAWEARASDGTTVVLIGDAAHIAFTNPVNVSQANGDFTGAAGVPATYTSFTFDPFAPIAPLWTFTVGAVKFSFDLKSITSVLQTTTQLNLTGTGTAYAAGFDDTPFTWTFSGDSTIGEKAILSFSASAFDRNVAVPEPSVVGLLGLGLIAMGAVGVRRRSVARKA